MDFCIGLTSLVEQEGPEIQAPETPSELAILFVVGSS